MCWIRLFDVLPLMLNKDYLLSNNVELKSFKSFKFSSITSCRVSVVPS